MEMDLRLKIDLPGSADPDVIGRDGASLLQKYMEVQHGFDASVTLTGCSAVGDDDSIGRWSYGFGGNAIDPALHATFAFAERPRPWRPSTPR